MEFYITRHDNRTGRLAGYLDLFNPNPTWRKELTEDCLSDDELDVALSCERAIERHRQHTIWWYDFPKKGKPEFLGEFYHEYESNFTIEMRKKCHSSQERL